MHEQEQSKRQTTRLSREARGRRIFERAREGLPYDEIGREEGLSAERVRQIVVNALEGKSRKAVRAALHARLQMDRVGEAMRVAGDALRRGEVRAVGPFLKAVAQLDGYRDAAAGLDLVGREQPPEAPDLQALAEEFAELMEDEGNAAAAALAEKLAAVMKDRGIEARETGRAVAQELADLMGCEGIQARGPAAAPTPAEALEAKLWGPVTPESASNS
ncbi:MAG: hypothetical protein JO288_00955 [Hyphomicrobiales bacterium]|nr:hypothetical protein [Hyphomicrobiales bacterium]